MTTSPRASQMFRAEGVDIETYVDGAGPVFVMLPSYGRDGGRDFDDLTDRLVEAEWTVLRPQPRGIGRSRGRMTSLTLHDLGQDVALVIKGFGHGPAVVLGHAFGSMIARVMATDHADLTRAVVLASAQTAHAPHDVAEAPFVAGDLNKPRSVRLQALSAAFFAPNHDASVWLDGWYPETLAMQRAAVSSSDQGEFIAAGTVPLLQLIGDRDPFIPKEDWDELTRQLGDKVTRTIVGEASHALFPEQPSGVAQIIASWAARHR